MDEIIEFYEANKSLFHTNHRPTNYQADQVFRFANLVDPKGNHKPTSCGRCYRSALRVVVEYCRKNAK